MTGLGINPNAAGSPESAGGNWAAPRHGSPDVPRTRPPKPVRVDEALLEAWDDYEAANQRARRAYYNDKPATEKPKPTLAERRARFQARKEAS